MADYLARKYYNGDGQTETFVLPATMDYLDQDDIHVYVDRGSGLIEESYSWYNSSTVEITPAPPSGTGNVLVLRRTQSDSRIVNFVDGSVLTAADQNKNSNQQFFLMQEALDVSLTAEDAMEGAIAARVAAEAAEDGAVAAKTAAETAQGLAETAKTAAQTAQTNAETAETNAELAQTAAESAQDAAELARDQAVTAKNAAESAQTAAVAAKTAAETAETNAETAESGAVAAKTAAETAESNAEAAEAAAAISEDNAYDSEVAAAASEAAAENWAIKTDGPVEGGEYSSKYHAAAAKTWHDGGFQLDSIPDSDLGYSGFWGTCTVDTNGVGVGAALKMGSDGNFDTAAASTESTMPVLALALETGTGSKKVLFRGFLRNDSWSWTPGSLLYASATTGLMTHTPPGSAGNIVQVLGVAITADVILFNPNYGYAEIG